MDNYNTLKYDVTAEIVEKKSRFIANIFYIENENEAMEKLKEIRKKYYDARHNCFAYRVMNGKNIVQRSSDDGEPSGTAGAPILNIIEKNNYVNILVVVTRYFGGILLGTGGLVKAYSGATLKALELVEIVEKEYGYLVVIKSNYLRVNDVKSFIKSNNIIVVKEEFLENVIINVEINEKMYEKMKIFFPDYETNNVEIYKVEERLISKNC